MLQYEIRVKDVLNDGHPIQVLASNLYTASKCFDDFVKRYPNNEVTMDELIKHNIKLYSPLINRQVDCPRGYIGLSLNNKHVVYEGSDGKMRCAICGWVEE